MTREMKDSGVEWIGVIPSNWKTSRIGSEFKVRNQKVSDKDYMPLSVTKLTEGIVPQMDQVAKSDAHDDRKLVLKGDFVINSRSDRKMSCGVSNYDGSVSLINIVLEPVGEILPNYTHYLLKNYAFAEEFYKWGHGIVADLWTTNSSDLKRITVPFPNIEEQKKIVETLDKKISQIDTLIANQEKQIETLKKNKNILISNVVTKGIDKNVKLKESGVYWIGEIPEHWNTIRIKFTSWLKGRIGWDGLKATEFLENGPYLITGTDFENGEINWNTCVHISEERYEEDELLHIEEDDLLITKDGTIGKLAIVKNCPEKVSLNSGVMIIRNVGDFKYSNKYLYYVLQSNQFLLWYELSQSGNSTIRHLYQGQFYNFEYTYPSYEEQLEIASYLDERCSAFDRLIAIKQSKIDELQEYKKSIIYEYVTGKKEAI